MLTDTEKAEWASLGPPRWPRYDLSADLAARRAAIDPLTDALVAP